MSVFTAQSEFNLRFDWAAQGISALQESDAFVIVDVLSFCTCVSIVVESGGAVYPFAFKDDRAAEYAQKVGAQLASPSRSLVQPSLSPQSLLGIGPIKIVLPSPNGSELTRRISDSRPDAPIFAASLRNAHAVAKAVGSFGRVSIIAAGERWPDGSTRFAIEDLIGAGAVLSCLRGAKSPEATVAETAFSAHRQSLYETLLRSASGQELVQRGFEGDVRLASDLDVATAAAQLVSGRFICSESN